MGLASRWADAIKGNPAYRWTSPFHYYDIENDPPLSCGKFLPPASNRSINLYNGVKRALNNHTCSSKRKTCNRCGSKFHNGMMMHLLQDAFQPLHLTGKARGGNEVWFVKNGTKYNLHKFWDTNVLEMHLKDVGYEDDIHKAVAYFYDKMKNTTLPENSCPTNVNSSNMDVLDYIFGKSQKVLDINCDLVWRTEIDDYIELSKEMVQGLIISSITTLNCVLERIYGNLTQTQSIL